MIKIRRRTCAYCHREIRQDTCYMIDKDVVCPDCLEDYLEGNDPAHYCVDEFDSHAEFEKWLLNAVADWIKDDPLMIEDLDQYLKLA